MGCSNSRKIAFNAQTGGEALEETAPILPQPPPRGPPALTTSHAGLPRQNACRTAYLKRYYYHDNEWIISDII